MDYGWRVKGGLEFMVAKRLKQHGYPPAAARLVRRDLAVTPIHKWPGQLQDVAFAAVASQPGGWRHWYLAGSRCNGLVPAAYR